MSIVQNNGQELTRPLVDPQGPKGELAWQFDHKMVIDKARIASAANRSGNCVASA